MKTVSVFVILCALAAGPSGSSREPGARSAGVGMTNAARGALKDQIVAKEREELDSLKTGDMKVFADLLAEDAVFVDAHGSAGKAEVVKNSSEFRLLEYSMEDIRFVAVSPSAGLIAYKINEKGTSHGREFTAKVNVSALWTERDGRWVCLFSQETVAR